VDVHRAYRVLGLSPDASAEAVREAYRDLAQVWHPDRFAHNERLRDKAARNLQRINEAFDLVRDRVPDAPMPRRSVIDMTLDTVRDLGDIMHTAVSGGPPLRPRRGPAVLGLGPIERTATHRVARRRKRRTSVRRTVGLAIVVLVLVAVAAWLVM
jgi:curved DNA-binding protein CbpA